MQKGLGDITERTEYDLKNDAAYMLVLSFSFGIVIGNGGRGKNLAI